MDVCLNIRLLFRSYFMCELFGSIVTLFAPDRGAAREALADAS